MGLFPTTVLTILGTQKCGAVLFPGSQAMVGWTSSFFSLDFPLLLLLLVVVVVVSCIVFSFSCAVVVVVLVSYSVVQ